MDRRRRCQDRLHHARQSLGEWLLREPNSKLRDELLDGEIFYTLKEAQIVIEGWRQHYNTVRPHSSLDYRVPAPEAILWPAAQPGARQARAYP